MASPILVQATAAPTLRVPRPLPKPTQTPQTIRPTINIGPARNPGTSPAPDRPSGSKVNANGKPSIQPGAATAAEMERKRVETERAQQERARKVGLCQAAKGLWFGSALLTGLSAKGSDVDQIYGKISVWGIPAAGFKGSGHSGTGARPQDLWASDENVNLGKNPQLQNSSVGWSTTTAPTSIGIKLDLYDEDDRRGGSNDDYFYVNENSDRYDNIRRFNIYIPLCTQEPEFEREWRTQIVATQFGNAAKNQVMMFVRIRISRQYP